MLRPLIERPRRNALRRSRERGVTMALVALSLVAIISMAALSIDLGTLYEAKAEAQRAADLAALTAARMISLEGATGDPTKGPGDAVWTDICGGPNSPASVAAISVAQQNLINGSPASTVNVYYGTSAGVGTAQSCTGAGIGFTVNPVVQVYVQQASLPTFFARIFSLITKGTPGNSGVSATATAEVFNSSGSGSLPSGMIPVQPRCVKPWIIPNVDPGNASAPFLNPDGTINNAGVSQLGGGVIGESFNMNADCTSPGSPGACALTTNPPGYSGFVLHYVPALVSGTPVAVPSGSSCSLNAGFQSAIAGCDQTTAYSCGTPNAVQYDLTENPVNPGATTGDTATAVECLTNNSTGSDSLDAYPGAITYPFQIHAGFGNPLVQAGVVNDNKVISVSNNIVTIPIYDSTPGVRLPAQVTIIGFLQVFINGIVGGPAGNLNVTVMNIAGCSNSAGGNQTVTGTSPVPIRLITTP